MMQCKNVNKYCKKIHWILELCTLLFKSIHLLLNEYSIHPSIQMTSPLYEVEYRGITFLEQLLCWECMKQLEASSVSISWDRSGGDRHEVLYVRETDNDTKRHGCIYHLKDNKYENSGCCTLTALSSVGHRENRDFLWKVLFLLW